jgi:hypothetical protein
MLDKTIQDIISQFSKRELLMIAGELLMDWENSKGAVLLAQALSDKLRIIVHSDEEEELSDLAYEFCIVSEIIDEDGNELEVKEVKPETPPTKLPECFVYSAANPADPSCKKCRVLEQCKESRIKNRPKCFGNKKLFKPDSPECSACLEFVDNFCPQAIKDMGV